MSTSRAVCVALDAEDPLKDCRSSFVLPEGVIYLDGNSLGALPKAVPAALKTLTEQEWGRDLIGGWNQHGWIDLGREVGAKLAPLLGARAEEVIAADSISVNLFKLLAAALRLRPGRRVILSSAENFPTDLYVAQGLEALLERSRCELKLVPEAQLAGALDDSVAVLMATHVNFRSGRLLDMAGLTSAAHEVGALVLWDLAHSAGALPLALDELAVDLAVGCGYKYLNGGPGAPAYAYVAARHLDALEQPLSGWMGHADPFAFSPSYEPAPGIERLQAGTPSVLAMRALSAALDLWKGVDMARVRAKSLALAALFLELVESSSALADLELRSPRAADERGSQLSFAHAEGYAMVQALIAEGVIGDFRAPDLLRFGFTPLYLRYVDVWDAVAGLERIVVEGRHREPQFQKRARVT